MNQYLTDLRDWTPLFWEGLQITILVSVVAMLLSCGLGLLVALLRIGKYPPALRFIPMLLRGYVEVFRGLPLIVQLFIIFFALPSAGLTISDNPVIAGIIGMSLNLGAYLSEVFRAALLSVDPGQMEAARSIGMSRRRSYQRIVIPQAFVVAVPTLGGYFISLLKDTSLLGFISVFELMRSGIVIVTTTFKAFEVYFTIGAIYLVLSLIAAWAVARVERFLRPLERAYTGRQRVDKDIVPVEEEVLAR
jgi:His/Glu/Gln/Arg/opine family amino acid ABC transporter permease subunit